MKVLISVIPKDLQHAETIENILENLEIDYYSCSSVKHKIDNKFTEYLENINNSTHLVLVLTKEWLIKKSVSFEVGYAFGKKFPIIIYIVDSDSYLLVPPHLQNVPASMNVQDLEAFFREEKITTRIKRKMSFAKEILVEMGVSYSEPVFFDVVERGNLPATFLFVEAGIGLNMVNENGFTPLMIALKARKSKVALALIDSGADVDIFPENSERTPLMEAASIGDPYCIKSILRKTKLINAQQKDGCTALMLAAGAGHYEAAKILIENNADPELVDKMGMSALKYASLFKKEKIEKLLKGE